MAGARSWLRHLVTPTSQIDDVTHLSGALHLAGLVPDNLVASPSRPLLFSPSCRNQVEDRAERKGIDMGTAERWLAPVLGSVQTSS